MAPCSGEGQIDRRIGSQEGVAPFLGELDRQMGRHAGRCSKAVNALIPRLRFSRWKSGSPAERAGVESDV
jgi:hypothetical protein